MTDQEVAEKLRERLSPTMLSRFTQFLENHGTISPVLGPDDPLNDVSWPWPVHFREGMWVRNQLREITDYSWTDHEYDNRWQHITEMAIKPGCGREQC